jgi:hypothetical protein
MIKKISKNGATAYTARCDEPGCRFILGFGAASLEGLEASLEQHGWDFSSRGLRCPEPHEPHEKLESIEHPAHYGGADDPYEAIKVIEAWGLDFALGNAVKYICRAGKKPGADRREDLKKALWYLRRAAGEQADEGKLVELCKLVCLYDANGEDKNRSLAIAVLVETLTGMGHGVLRKKDGS